MHKLAPALTTRTCTLTDIFTLPQRLKVMAFYLHMTLSGLRQQAQPTSRQQVCHCTQEQLMRLTSLYKFGSML